MQGGGRVLFIGKIKAVGSNPTAIFISLFVSFSLFSSFFIFVETPYLFKEALTYRKIHKILKC